MVTALKMELGGRIYEDKFVELSRDWQAPPSMTRLLIEPGMAAYRAKSLDSHILRNVDRQAIFCFQEAAMSYMTRHLFTSLHASQHTQNLPSNYWLLTLFYLLCGSTSVSSLLHIPTETPVQFYLFFCPFYRVTVQIFPEICHGGFGWRITEFTIWGVRPRFWE